MNQLGQIIAQKLESIEHNARQTLRDVEAIRGVCLGYAAAMWDFNFSPPSQTYQSGNGYQEIISTPSIANKTVDQIIEEVKKLIIELKIKGSVREHRDGLLKFTSPVFGCVYGRTKEELEKKLKEKIKQFKSDKIQKDNKKGKVKPPLLSEYYATEYLPFKKRQNLTKSSLDSIDTLFRFIVGKKFDKRLTEYTPKMIENFLYSVPQTKKRQKLQGLLKNMFTRAVALELVKTNPCDTIERVKHKQEQGKAFSFDEQEEFFHLLVKNCELTYSLKCYFIFLYLTGARRNEALAIQNEDVDFQNKVLSIRGTKTKGSNRQIPLTPLVENLLHSLKIDHGSYFPFSDSLINHKFRVAWDKAKGHKPHDLRHTFGTIQICVKKVDIKTVSLWLGHSTIDMTMNIYTHPEQLDSGTFLRGDLTADEKNAIYLEKYSNILTIIENFLLLD